MDSGSPSNLRSKLDGGIIHVHPKKRLGQHFLRWKEVGERIVDSLGAKKEDTVIEIGAGTGELTRLIVDRVSRIVAVEVDETCFPTLRVLADLHKNLELFLSDVRELDIDRYGCVDGVLGNLPYHLSAEILFWLLDRRKFWKKAVLTVQAEFAERLTAQLGSHDYSALSVVAQAFLKTQKLFEIDPRAFAPVPKVRSITIKVEPLEKPLWPDDPATFSRLVRQCFAHRRKTLANNLKMIGVPSPAMVIENTGHLSNVRPQELSPGDYVKLIDIIA